jgi:23S rRNA (cytidine1920-2'-O)/16S rRNA (cytidine1409-2'-O)-methyltransferase
MAKERLDKLMVSLGLVQTRQQAQSLILAGEVEVNDQIETSAGKLVEQGANINLKAGLPYVSRGGIKLAWALDRFGLNVFGKTALDVGASTGGFTDCLLQRGIELVYAVDVGYGQIAWPLRQNPKVAVKDRVNARYLKPEDIGALVDLVVMDVSFISVTKILPVLLLVTKEDADFVVLVKPQFEVGKGQVGKGGIVKDPALHRHVIQQVAGFAVQIGLTPLGLEVSPIAGTKGNREFLLWLHKGLLPPWDLNARLESLIPLAANNADLLRQI